MKSAKCNQAQLAERAGLSQGEVSRLLSGKRMPTIETAYAIERATAGKVTVRSWGKAA